MKSYIFKDFITNKYHIISLNSEEITMNEIEKAINSITETWKYIGTTNKIPKFAQLKTGKSIII